MASKSNKPFIHLQATLSTFFDLTINQGTTLKFLDMRIIQSPCGISFDQTKYIQSQILDTYFKDIPPSSIPHRTYPFPIEASFEQHLYESPTLTDIDLQNTEAKYKTLSNHLVGKVMHITTISCPDLSYACMRFSGYMACPNEPIFSALHHCLCYLYHHPHLLIMYPNKAPSTPGGSINTFCLKDKLNTYLLNLVIPLLPSQMLTMPAAYALDALYLPTLSYTTQSSSLGVARNNPSLLSTQQAVK
jgi:hypothetical protein